MSPSYPQSGWTDIPTAIHMTSSLVLLSIILAVFVVTKRWFFPDGQLPGPPSIPILGNLYVIFFNPTNFIAVLTKLSKFYGDVYSFRMGSVPAIVVCGRKAARDVLVDKADVFNERPHLGYMKDHPEELGIFFQNGERWSYLRKLTLRTIHDLDTARPHNIRRYIVEEMQELVEFVKAKNGRPFDPREILTLVTANTMCSLMLNKRFDYTDKRIKRLVKNIDRMFDIEGFGQMEHFIPVLRYLKHLGIGASHMDEIVKLRREIKDFILSEDCSSYLSQDDPEVTSLADAYRKRVGGDADDVLSNCLLDVFGAGTSASSVFSWLFAYIVNFPSVVHECTAEISKVIGDAPLNHHVREGQLPYVNATIHEVLRMSSAIPTTAPHMASEDTILNGHQIDKGTLVLVNLHSVNQEEEYWGDPHVFRPSRFLDAAGDFVKDKSLSFGAGPRGCLGKEIAKKMIFTFFLTMLTNFDIRVPVGSAPPSLKGVMKIVYEPKPFQIVALPR